MSLLSTLFAATIEPFIAFGFMRRALVATLALSLAAGPLGTILILRRMSLMGDALSHAVLPGVALGFLLAGLSLPIMSLGGVLSGLAVALAAGLVTRFTRSNEDASFASFYLIALAIGVTLVSLKGNNVDLLRLLFGSILGIDNSALVLIAALVSVALLVLAVIWRPLILDCFDTQFLAAMGGRGGIWHGLYLTLLALVLVASFQTLGTLMAIGLLMLPATAARFWSQSLGVIVPIASGMAMVSGFIGLVISFNSGLPAGPSIILVAGGVYLLSLILGRYGVVRLRRRSHRHLRG
ncbi:MAG: metal ABC transporter permease [Candidatus Pacebacteria bacterium]|nr:metal ABC transporter permease [Candidatus Paceibacterota bacterium]